MESEGGLTSNGNKAPSIAEGIEQLCLGEELEAVVASRLGDGAFNDHDNVGHDGQNQDNNDYELCPLVELAVVFVFSCFWCDHYYEDSPERYVLKIHFFIEFGLKMIQFKIQFKTKSKIFIQKNIHSIEFRIFNRFIHS